MRPRGSLLQCLLTCILCARFAYTTHAEPQHTKRQYDDVPVRISQDKDGQAREFFTFITRPDIIAPRWNITVHEEGANLAPGYWFVALYEDMNQNANQRRSWVGPHIYDEKGGLIWSGAPLFSGWDVADFHVANVNGEDLLSGLWKSEQVDFFLDNSYNFHKKVQVGQDGAKQNMHDWHTAWNGTRAIAIVNEKREASREESESVGFHGGFCKVAWNGFEEYDTSTWELLFHWDPETHILLNESFVEVTNGMCRNHWDYIHLNSVDKFADGDFLLSARHTDTLYKISAEDGHIVWRFNGRNWNSDVDFRDHFSGQHHSRIHMENDTHTIITLMDNAIRPGYPHVTNNHSRAMSIVMDKRAQPMTADVLQTYIHPQQEYAIGRGSMQILDNGNVFAGWWWKSLQSEYSADGKLLMEAETIPELKNYRSYKYPWTGRPQDPPDVVAVDEMNLARTTVYVSWNGATEVQKWNAYAVDNAGSRELVASAPRDGFETAFTFDKPASHVVVEALDSEGSPLGESKVTASISTEDLESSLKTEPPDHDPPERKPLAHHISDLLSVFDDSVVAYAAGAVTCAVAFWVLRLCWRLTKRKARVSWWRQKDQQAQHAYERVENEENEEIYMDELEAKTGEREPG